MKRLKQLLLALMAVAALLVLCVTLLKLYRERGTTSYSVYENRTMASFPVLTKQSLLDGEYFAAWDDYINDHVPKRNDLLSGYLAYRLYVKQMTEVNDTVIGERALLPVLIMANDDEFDYDGETAGTAKRLLPIQQAVESYGGIFLYVGIEEQRAALLDEYPAHAVTRERFYLGLEEAFERNSAQVGINTLFMRDQFRDVEDPLYYYSAVDHHYNLRGAFRTYQAICQTLQARGLELPVLSEEDAGICELKNEMNGTYSRKFFGMSPVTERFQSCSMDAFPAYSRWDDGEQTDRPLLELPEDDEPVPYAAYMGGDMAETIVRTNRPELPNILIVGDSFTNPVEIFSVFSFNEMRSLDFRHYTEKTLTEYLRDYPADAVVVIRDSLNYRGTDGNGGLQ